MKDQQPPRFEVVKGGREVLVTKMFDRVIFGTETEWRAIAARLNARATLVAVGKEEAALMRESAGPQLPPVPPALD